MSSTDRRPAPTRAPGRPVGEISIRPATPGDLPGILELLAELHAGSDQSPDPNRAGEVFVEVLSAPGRTVLVAEQAGALLGHLDLVVVPNLTRGARPWAIVENVVVAEVRRREGIGKALIGEAIERARMAGCYKVQLLSRRHRAGAHRLYSDLGFEASAEGFRLYF